MLFCCQCGGDAGPLHEFKSFKCEDALGMERELELFWPSVQLSSLVTRGPQNTKSVGFHRIRIQKELLLSFPGTTPQVRGGHGCQPVEGNISREF